MYLQTGCSAWRLRNFVDSVRSLWPRHQLLFIKSENTSGRKIYTWLRHYKGRKPAFAPLSEEDAESELQDRMGRDPSVLPPQKRRKDVHWLKYQWRKQNLWQTQWVAPLVAMPVHIVFSVKARHAQIPKRHKPELHQYITGIIQDNRPVHLHQHWRQRR